TPYGQLPVLEVDGKEIAQSYAICRYLARKHGLAGKDDLEAAQVDSLADFMKDIGTDVRPWFVVALGREDGDKDKLEKDVLLPAVEKAFKKLETVLNNAGSGFLVASGVTWVDFVLAERLHTFELLKPDILKPYPKIKEYLNRVYNLPQTKDYIESRPKSNV
ncbi:Nagst-1 protein, partial [Aphelenchoides avenae]